jgi:uncharacterized protein (TIGR02271 family)
VIVGRAVSDIVRHEEELVVDRRDVAAGAVKARKVTEVEHVTEQVARELEQADVERVAPDERDSGEIETLPDGSVSIPLFEEQLVVTKRLVVRERVIVRKRTVTEQHQVDADLRHERIEVDKVGDVEVDEASVAPDDEGASTPTKNDKAN